MSKKCGWLIALSVVALLVAACGPELATPTPRAPSGDVASPSSAAETEDTSVPKPTARAADTTVPVSRPPAELPVAEDDWHVLGSPEAVVTIFEYSDFQ